MDFLNAMNRSVRAMQHLSCCPSAVDDEHAAGGKAAGGTGQVDRGTLNLAELSPTTHHRCPDNIVFDIGLFGYALVHFGQKRAWANRIAGDVPWSKLQGHRAGQLDDGSFAGRVGGPIGKSHEAQGASDMNDPAVALLFHRLDEGSCHEPGSLDIRA